MMTREELETAFHAMQHDPATGRPAVLVGWDAEVVTRALFKQLALMAEKCGTCGGVGFIVTSVLMGGQAGYAGPTCPTCHGSGKVYPQETVEKIAEAIYGGGWDQISEEVKALVKTKAVAVLDALGETE